MIHSDTQLLEWLRAHTQRDRVIFNALCNLQSVEVTHYAIQPVRWAVDIVSRRGVKYRVVIVMHPVTGEPERWYRVEGTNHAI